MTPATPASRGHLGCGATLLRRHPEGLRFLRWSGLRAQRWLHVSRGTRSQLSLRAWQAPSPAADRAPLRLARTAAGCTPGTRNDAGEGTVRHDCVARRWTRGHARRPPGSLHQQPARYGRVDRPRRVDDRDPPHVRLVGCNACGTARWRCAGQPSAGFPPRPAFVTSMATGGCRG